MTTATVLDAAAETARPAFLPAGTTIRGMAVTPPSYWARVDPARAPHYRRPPYEGQWDAQDFGLPPARRDAALRAGINTIRLFVDAGPFMDAVTAGALNRRSELVAALVDTLGRFIGAGFRLVVNVNAELDPPNPAFARRAVLDGPSGPGSFAYGAALCVITQAAASRFDPRQVAIELINEPLYSWEWGERAPWPSQAQALWLRARSVAPHHTLIVQGRDAAWYGALAEFNPRQFDTNTLFCFHPYEPGGFTHQGIGDNLGISRLTFPASQHPGGHLAALDQLHTRVAALPGIDDARRAALIRHGEAELANIFWAPDPMSASRMDREWGAIDSWLRRTGTSPLQVIAGEFGANGDFNANGSLGADLASRARYYRAVRENVERRGFAGWIAWQSVGDFNLFEQSALGTHGDNLVPELAAALGLQA